MSLRNYLASFHENIQKLEDYGYTESIEISEEIRPNKQTIINGKISFVNGSVLHIKEYIDTKYKIERLSYAYQYQNRGGELIFRYDNAVHRPALGYSEHKHMKDGVIIEACLPDISEVIDEMIECM